MPPSALPSTPPGAAEKSGVPSHFEYSTQLRRVVAGTVLVATTVSCFSLSMWSERTGIRAGSSLRLADVGDITVGVSARYGRGMNLVDIDGDGNLDLWLSTAMPPLELKMTSTQLKP